jgi:hypothetical protein
MFYKKEEYKQEIENLFSRNGFLIKLIDPGSHRTIGNIIRYEINNNENEANVLVNISFFESYKNYLNYSEKDLKYFGIKHSFKFSKNLDKLNYFKINDIQFDTKVKNLVEEKGEHISENVIEFIIAKLKNIEFYYKNKDIGIFFV